MIPFLHEKKLLFELKFIDWQQKLAVLIEKSSEENKILNTSNILCLFTSTYKNFGTKAWLLLLLLLIILCSLSILS